MKVILAVEDIVDSCKEYNYTEIKVRKDDGGEGFNWHLPDGRMFFLSYNHIIFQTGEKR